MKYIPFVFILFATLISCSDNQEGKDTSSKSIADTNTIKSISSKHFGVMPNGKAVTLYTMKNKNGIEMTVMNYGGIVVSLNTPDRNGLLEDITLGFDSLSPYLGDDPFFGALIGRYGNRIAKGKFTLDEKSYTLATNNAPNHLHGGPNGYYNVFWNIDVVSYTTNPALKLTYLSKDGEEGYPGNLNIEVIYTLSENNEFKIDYKATTDKKTIVNLTQHTYFNLTGNLKQDILNHELTINADKFLPVDETLIPTGKLKEVKNTPFDFTVPTKIGDRISYKEEQLIKGLGYDHCWVFTNQKDTLKLVASLYDSTSGRFMEVLTSEPALQFYSGNFLNDKLIGKKGVVNDYRYGICLETQHFPDSPNQKLFPTTILNPGETYKTTTVYRFSVKL